MSKEKTIPNYSTWKNKKNGIKVIVLGKGKLPEIDNYGIITATESGEHNIFSLDFFIEKFERT